VGTALEAQKQRQRRKRERQRQKQRLLWSRPSLWAMGSETALAKLQQQQGREEGHRARRTGAGDERQRTSLQLELQPTLLGAAALGWTC